MSTAVLVLEHLSLREKYKFFLPNVEAEGRRTKNGLAEGKLLHPQQYLSTTGVLFWHYRILIQEIPKE